jgi:hypothetical protein
MASQTLQQPVARVLGTLFLLPFFAYGIGHHLTETALAAATPHLPIAIIGVMLLLLNSLCVAAIGIVSYPILLAYSPRTAIGYLVARLAEALLLSGGIVLLLTALPIGSVPPADTSLLEGSLALRGQFWSYQLAMLALGIGSVPFCYACHILRLVPAYMAWWGMAGYALLGIGAVLECCGYPIGVLLSVPGGLFEIIFAFRLITRKLG